MLDPQLLPSRQLFRFSFDIRRLAAWRGADCDLDESYRLPHLAALEGERPVAEVRMGWAPEGLAWRVDVAGKSQPPWCRESRLDDSDGLQVWVDTRATHNVHRATRFCHRFAFLPLGGDPRGTGAAADQLLINRARENARPVRPRELAARSKATSAGYTLWGAAAAAALGGYDPQQHPRLGFTYAVLDRERGLQTFSQGAGFPYEEDPSQWAELRLVG